MIRPLLLMYQQTTLPMSKLKNLVTKCASFFWVPVSRSTTNVKYLPETSTLLINQIKAHNLLKGKSDLKQNCTYHSDALFWHSFPYPFWVILFWVLT